MVRLTLISGKVMEQLLSEHISVHVKEKVMTESCWRGFTKRKSCQTTQTVSASTMPSVIKRLDLYRKGEQRIPFVWTVARLSVLSPTILCPGWAVMIWMGGE